MRDFEKEYQSYIKEDTPDLWDRIEAALPEKNAGDVIRIDEHAEKESIQKTDSEHEQSAKEKVNTDSVQMQRELPEKPKENKNSRLLSFSRRIMPVAAALGVMVLVLGALRLSNRSKNAAGSGPASDSSAASDDAAYGVVDGAEVFDSAPEDAAEAVQDFGDASYADEAADSVAAGDTAAMNGTNDQMNAFDASDELQSTSDDAAGEDASVAFTSDKHTDALKAKQKEEAEAAAVSQGDELKIKKALLSDVFRTDSDMQDQGYSDELHFILEDGSEILAYLKPDSFRQVIEYDTIVRCSGIKFDLMVEPFADMELVPDGFKEAAEKGEVKIYLLKDMKRSY